MPLPKSRGLKRFGEIPFGFSIVSSHARSHSKRLILVEFPSCLFLRGETAESVDSADALSQVELLSFFVSHFI